MPLSLRPLAAADLPRGLVFTEQSDWNQTLADWRRTHALAGEGLLGGWEGDCLVATGSLFTYPGGPTWIGMILVDAAQRRRGFGRQMMQAVLERAQRRSGEAVGLDASEFGRPLYLSLGFHDVAPIARWAGKLAAPRQPNAAPAELHISAGAAAELSPAALAELVAFDRRQLACDRAGLLCALAQQPEARIYRATAGAAADPPLLGYGLVRGGRLAWHLGPLVADAAATGRAVIDAVARDFSGETLFCDVFELPEAAAALARVGLTSVRQLTRMTLGQPQPLLMGPAAWAAASFEYG